MRRTKFRRSDYEEKPKDHDDLPDALGIGYLEERNHHGLFIYFRATFTCYVMVGKYKEPQPDGCLYYVADYTDSGLMPKRYRFNELLPAISKIYDIAKTVT